MPFLGEKLRYKRMAMGLSLKEAAKKSGIKRKHLENLEKEDVLSFRDKKNVVDNLEKYAAALNLNRDEIMEEFEYLWSDSSTAKAYLQRRYRGSGKGLFSIDRKMVAYGAAALSAALFLSIGGYLVWGSLGDQVEPAGLIASPVKEIEETDPGSPELEETANDSKPGDEVPTEKVEDPALIAKNEPDQEPDCETGKPAEPGEEQEQGEESEITEAEEKDLITELEEKGASVPRTAGDMNLLFTGIYFIVSGIMLLVGINIFSPRYDRFIKS